MLSLGPLFNLYAFACTYCFAHFASQTSGLCSACTSAPYGILHACFFMFCVLRLANTGFVQCLHLGSLSNFARVCFYVLRASPRKHRVCTVLFPRPLLSFYACVCHILLCVPCITNIEFVQCFSLGSLLKRLYAYVPHVLLCVFSPINVGFVQCLSLGPLLSLYAYLCRVMFCVLRLKNISSVKCFSLGSLLSLHAYIGHVLSKQSNLFLHFLSTSKRFRRFSVPDAFYESRKAKSQRAIGLHSCESVFI